MKKQLLGLLVLGLFSMDQAVAALSTFDDDLDGWTYYNRNSYGDNPSSLTWGSTGGNLGGFAKFTDGDWDHAAISAPTKFLGNWSSVASIQYDLKIISAGDSPTFLPQYVMLENSTAGISAYWEGDEPTGSTDWETQTVMLNDPRWSVTGGTLAELLANVTDFIITIELVEDYQTDIEGIDNVNVSAVPIPAALWLFTSGIVGLITQAKRKKRTT